MLEAKNTLICVSRYSTRENIFFYYHELVNFYYSCCKDMTRKMVEFVIDYIVSEVCKVQKNRLFKITIGYLEYSSQN